MEDGGTVPDSGRLCDTTTWKNMGSWTGSQTQKKGTTVKATIETVAVLWV